MSLHLPLSNRLVRHSRSTISRGLKVLLDIGVITLTYLLAYAIRFEGNIPSAELTAYFHCIPILLTLTLTLFFWFGLYKGLYQYAGIKDLVLLFAAHTIACAAYISIIYMLRIQWTPRSVLFIYWLLGFITMGGARFSFRLFKELMSFSQEGKSRVLIVGAGSAGEMLLRQIKMDNKFGLYPVGIVDDDPNKRHVSIHGISVLGTTGDIPQLVEQQNIERIIIATPSAKAREMRKIVTYCETSGVDFKTVPGPRELMHGNVTLNQLRDLKIEDLLGRDPVATDGKRIAKTIRGRVVMVTGAGGSIGQELCWQIMAYRPEKLIMFDHSENSLFYLGNDLQTRWAGGFAAVVGSVCDAAKVDRVMREFKPSMMFHAAAHKHVPLMEMNPEEAIKNNLKGTMIIADASKKHKVGTFILISTDKAVEPASVMGASKRLAELYVQGINRQGKTKFTTVRLGNVLGSNGSVVTLFQKQIAKGGPITVTDPGMTRYFMTMSEAVALVLQASTIGNGGETYGLDMGEPVKVVDMARHLISLSGFEPDQDIAIEFTGKRPGEKMHERLWDKSEHPARTEYEKILVAHSNGHDYWYMMQQLEEVLELAETMQREQMFAKIKQLIPTYQSEENGVIVVDEDQLQVY